MKTRVACAVAPEAVLLRDATNYHDSMCAYTFLCCLYGSLMVVFVRVSKYSPSLFVVRRAVLVRDAAISSSMYIYLVCQSMDAIRRKKGY